MSDIGELTVDNILNYLRLRKENLEAMREFSGIEHKRTVFLGRIKEVGHLFNKISRAQEVHGKQEQPDYSRNYGLPDNHRAWIVLNRVKNALDADDYTLDAIWEAAEKRMEEKMRNDQ